MSEAPEPTSEGQEELVSACLAKAKQYNERGLYEEAAKVLKAALNLEPENTEILNNLALAYYNQEKYEEALPHVQHAHRLDPADYYAVAIMGHAFANTERWRAAIEQLEILYPLNQNEALKLFRQVFASFNNLLFDRLIDVSNKHADQSE